MSKEITVEISVKFRAIYIGDIRFNEVTPFEYNKSTNAFEMIDDSETSYSSEIVLQDDDWLLFTVTACDDEEEVKLVSKNEFIDTSK